MSSILIIPNLIFFTIIKFVIPEKTPTPTNIRAYCRTWACTASVSGFESTCNCKNQQVNPFSKQTYCFRMMFKTNNPQIKKKIGSRRLTPTKSPRMIARIGIAKPLIMEQMLAAVIDFHSGELSLTTSINDVSGISVIGAASCKL